MSVPREAASGEARQVPSNERVIVAPLNGFVADRKCTSLLRKSMWDRYPPNPLGKGVSYHRRIAGRTGVCHGNQKDVQIESRTGSSMDQSNCLLSSRLGVRIPPGAWGASNSGSRREGTDSSTAEPLTFNQRDAGSNPARCIDCCGSSTGRSTGLRSRRMEVRSLPATLWLKKRGITTESTEKTMQAKK
jgi:hypothetical protein